METKVLQKVLASVRPATAKKNILEQATHFIFTGNEVVTYNDQLCILHPLATDFSGSVKADDLYRIVSGITDKEIELKQKKTQLEVKSSGTKAGLALLNAGNKDIRQQIMSMGLLEEKDWLQLPEDFIPAMFLCMFAASKDQTKGADTCVFVNGSEMWAGDEVRISHYKMKGRMQSFLLPASSAVELSKFNVKQYALSESWVHFRTEDGVVFNARRMDGEDKYPDLSEYFEVEGTMLTLPESLKDAVEKIAPMVEAEIELDKAIEVQIKNKKIRCRAEKERGWVEKFVDVEVENEALFHINPVFLAQILDKSTKATIGEYVVRFEAGVFEHVIALKPQKKEEEKK